VTGTARTKRQHGTYDRRQRVFQCGGEYANFVYHRLGLLTLDADVFLKALSLGAERLEWVDHELNQCWSVTRIDAQKHGKAYEDRIGRRWGIPLDYARVSGPAGE
jgi:hypothetical protein